METAVVNSASASAAPPVHARRYMSKSQRACDFCRRRKSACRLDNGPPCQLCSIYNRPCLFQEGAGPRRKRTLPEPIPPPTAAPPEPTRLTSTASPNPLPALTNSNADESAFFAWLQPRTMGLSEPPAPNDPMRLDSAGLTDAELFGDWFASPTHPTPAMEITSPPAAAADLEGEYIGFSGDMDPYVLDFYKFDATRSFTFKKLNIKSVCSNPVPALVLGPAPQYRSADLNCNFLRDELNQMVPAEVGERLIALYWRFVAPQVPVLLEDDPLLPATSSPVLLAAVYYVAHPFARFDDYLNIQTAYDEPPLEALWSLCMSIAHDIKRRPSIPLLQALLILLASPPEDPLWPEIASRQTLLGQALSIAQSFGIHCSVTDWALTAKEQRLRKRIAWSLRLQDTWNSAANGRPPLISADNWLSTALDNDDFSSSEIGRGTAFLVMETAKLTEVMIDMLQSLFSLRAVHELCRDHRQTMHVAQQIMERLNSWHSQFSASERPVQIDDIDHTAPLLLAYHFARIILIRAIYRPFHKSTESPATEDEIARASRLEAYHHFRIAARSTASRFNDFARSISDQQAQAFWPFWCTRAWSSLCNMWLLLYSTSLDDTESGECKVGIEQARNSMRWRASSLPMLRFALLRIDSIFWKGLDNVLERQMC